MKRLARFDFGNARKAKTRGYWRGDSARPCGGAEIAGVTLRA